MWQTHPFSKRVHRCSPIVIAKSLAVPWDSSSFSSNCSTRTSKRYSEEENVVSISLSTSETNFPLQKHYVVNPNGETMKKLVPKVMPKFHDNPTINESEIIVLLGHIWVYAKKEKARWEAHSFTIDIILKIPTVGVCGNMFQTSCSNFTTIQRLTRIIIVLRQVWVYVGKRKF